MGPHPPHGTPPPYGDVAHPLAIFGRYYDNYLYPARTPPHGTPPPYGDVAPSLYGRYYDNYLYLLRDGGYGHGQAAGGMTTALESEL